MQKVITTGNVTRIKDHLTTTMMIEGNEKQFKHDTIVIGQWAKIGFNTIFNKVDAMHVYNVKQSISEKDMQMVNSLFTDDEINPNSIDCGNDKDLLMMVAYMKAGRKAMTKPLIKINAES